MISSLKITSLNHSVDHHRLLRRLLLASVSTAMIMVGGGARLAEAAPAGASFFYGAATVSYDGNNTIIHQTSERTRIDWQSFDVAANESVQFIVPNSTSATLNRINSNGPSTISGSIRSNGFVYFVNAHGMIFDATSRVSANGFIASTADMGIASFYDNRAFGGDFDLPSQMAAPVITTAGTITVNNGGKVALIGPSIQNSGTINAPYGSVSLIATTGARTLVDQYNNFAVLDQDSGGTSLAVNLSTRGSITADGGRIRLLAQGNSDSNIAIEGTVQARNVSGNVSGSGFGTISNPGTVEIISRGNLSIVGKLDASALNQNDSAGTIILAAVEMGSVTDLVTRYLAHHNLAIQLFGSTDINLNTIDFETLNHSLSLATDSGSITLNGSIEAPNLTGLWLSSGSGDIDINGSVNLANARQFSMVTKGGSLLINGDLTLQRASQFNLSAEAGRIIVNGTVIANNAQGFEIKTALANIVINGYVQAQNAHNFSLTSGAGYISINGYIDAVKARRVSLQTQDGFISINGDLNIDHAESLTVNRGMGTISINGYIYFNGQKFFTNLPADDYIWRQVQIRDQSAWIDNPNRDWTSFYDNDESNLANLPPVAVAPESLSTTPLATPLATPQPWGQASRTAFTSEALTDLVQFFGWQVNGLTVTGPSQSLPSSGSNRIGISSGNGSVVEFNPAPIVTIGTEDNPALKLDLLSPGDLTESGDGNLPEGKKQSLFSSVSLQKTN
ncbi:MAG: filamentous hemagglutinin N-terminal domain-containing protein [Candidatus Pacebacteria bacterium]|nr:filamentous hemagglutinin N-terminal domain-containing protein [Candidatus Paceibacterota bacterium]